MKKLLTNKEHYEPVVIDIFDGSVFGCVTFNYEPENFELLKLTIINRDVTFLLAISFVYDAIIEQLKEKHCFRLLQKTEKKK